MGSKLPLGSSPITSFNILMGDGSIAVVASTENGMRETTVTSRVSADHLVIGRTLPPSEQASTERPDVVGQAGEQQ